MTVPWEDHKDLIQDLYLWQNQTLQHVMDFMKENHDFTPSKGQYERQLKKWQFKKNSKADVWKAVTYKTEKRKREGKESDVYMEGELVPREKVRKATARPHSYMSTIERLQAAPSPRTPPGVTICTPQSFSDDIPDTDNMEGLPCVKYQTVRTFAFQLGPFPRFVPTTNLDSSRTTTLDRHTVSGFRRLYNTTLQNGIAGIRLSEDYDMSLASFSTDLYTIISEPTIIQRLSQALYELWSQRESSDAERFSEPTLAQVFAWEFNDLSNNGKASDADRLVYQWFSLPGTLDPLDRLLRSKKPTIEAFAEAIKSVISAGLTWNKNRLRTRQ
ncbi:hypothetical protein BU16DRAFT_543960 [Lophium mytilinum]|uniref:Clr5 domain-containing protein n=1 Tax=Lophium mytilinum TaxID=390894 RepID=A0A6A6QF80_9PEZI|nr:hypothetical protein BU16DRAFT_543960 [Lophium mytilinum]